MSEKFCADNKGNYFGFRSECIARYNIILLPQLGYN